ncbi:MAG: sialate O-acetylesterase, partial [Candidatus Latescibacterota bacterium]
MVLQAGLPVPVWGWSIPNDEVTVYCNGNRVTARAGVDGRWVVELPPMEPGKVRDFTVTSGSSAGRLEFAEVAVGEVWLCSGQSNMAVP